MNLRVQKLAPNVLGVDTVAKLSPPQLRALKDRGYVFRAGYIDELSQQEVLDVVSNGLGLLPLTYAKEFSPDHTLERLRLLGLPMGAHVVLDLEAVAADTTADALKLTVNAWGRGIMNGGYFPTLYVGSQEIFTSQELTSLEVFRYWAGCSKLLDRNGAIAEPARGYSLIQGRPFNVDLLGDGTLFDVDFAREDYQGDVFSVVVAA